MFLRKFLQTIIINIMYSVRSYLLAMLGSSLYPSRWYSSAMWSNELMTLSSQSIVYGSAKSTSMPTSRVLFSTRSGSYSCEISNFPPLNSYFQNIRDCTHRVPDVPDGGGAYNGAALVQPLAAEELGEVDLVAENGALLDVVNVIDDLVGGKDSITSYTVYHFHICLRLLDLQFAQHE